MRYSIMLQLLTVTTFILLGVAALFAWIQTRTEPTNFNSINRYYSATNYPA